MANTVEITTTAVTRPYILVLLNYAFKKTKQLTGRPFYSLPRDVPSVISTLKDGEVQTEIQPFRIPRQLKVVLRRYLVTFCQGTSRHPNDQIRHSPMKTVR